MSFTDNLFIIDNIKSQDIGVNGCHLVRVGASEITRQLMGDKNIVENTVPYKDESYFYKVSKSPIEFDLQFSILEDKYNENILFELMKIFAKDRYVTFQSCDYLGMQFYVIATSIELVTYGLYQGWFRVHLRTSAPFAYSLPEISTFDFSTLTTPETFEIFCKSNVCHPVYNEIVYFPKLLIDMKGTATAITLTNNSFSGKQFGLTGLTTTESLEIDNDKKKIKSSTGLSRISNMLTGHPWFALTFGKNLISINAKAVIQIQCQFPLYI